VGPRSTKERQKKKERSSGKELQRPATSRLIAAEGASPPKEEHFRGRGEEPPPGIRGW